MTAGRILLWRHGRTTFNASKRFQGQYDAPLDAVGLAQASHAALFLAAELAGAGEISLVSSDLSRAALTAAALGSLLGVEATPDARLREVYVGEWQTLLYSEVQERWPDELAVWEAGEDVRVGGGEKKSEAGLRAAAAIREHAAAAPGNVLVVASHGAALNSAVQHLLGLPQKAGTFVGLRNTHWAELSVHQDVWRLVGYNLSAPGAAAVTAPATPPHPDLETHGGTPVDSTSRKDAKAL